MHPQRVITDERPPHRHGPRSAALHNSSYNATSDVSGSHMRVKNAGSRCRMNGVRTGHHQWSVVRRVPVRRSQRCCCYRATDIMLGTRYIYIYTYSREVHGNRVWRRDYYSYRHCLIMSCMPWLLSPNVSWLTFLLFQFIFK